ncbi:MAG: hypothetical protein KDA52_11950 [Planctomycetaceae bacterium]|nr:hypothetical protein [Planctomycetaceae bacterium]
MKYRVKGIVPTRQNRTAKILVDANTKDEAVAIALKRGLVAVQTQPVEPEREEMIDATLRRINDLAEIDVEEAQEFDEHEDDDDEQWSNKPTSVATLGFQVLGCLSFLLSVISLVGFIQSDQETSLSFLGSAVILFANGLIAFAVAGILGMLTVLVRSGIETTSLLRQLVEIQPIRDDIGAQKFEDRDGIV